MIWILHDAGWSQVAALIRSRVEVVGLEARCVDAALVSEMTVQVTADDPLRVFVGNQALALPSAVLVLRMPSPRRDDSLLPDGPARFVDMQWHVMLHGLLLALRHLDVPVINDPSSSIWDEKTAQLILASLVGLQIPDTVQTAWPQSAQLQSLPQLVSAKPFRPFRQTTSSGSQVKRSVTVRCRVSELVADLGRARVPAPIVVQPFVAAEREHRVVVVGSEVYAASRRRHGDNEVDVRSRPIADCDVQPSELPAQVADSCRQLVHRAGLEIGVIDLLEADGHYVFLDLNPGGHFFWVEQLTGLPIIDSITQLLVDLCPVDEMPPAWEASGAQST